MNKFIGLIAFLLTISTAFSNVKRIQGTWQGIMIRKGMKMEQGAVFYADFENNDGHINGLTREEMYDSPYFSVKKVDGDQDGNRLMIQQLVEVKSKKSSRQKWCRVSADLTYDPKTGYLTGEYVSLDCRRVMGTIILYKADFELTKEEELNVSHAWFDQFIKDYRDGLSAPEIRKIERDNFVFEPIFFDYDKWDIRPRHFSFLDGMIKVVKGHSDLRVRVTGHTDSDGSHGYNDELSKKRAQEIINYFVARGLSEDRLIIEFKGERNPVDSNDTSEGKQRNRRVDFRFI